MKSVVAAFWAAARHGEACKIGTGVITAVDILRKVFCRRMGAKLRAGELFRIGLDARAFERKTGWRPRYTLAEGVTTFVESLKN